MQSGKAECMTTTDRRTIIGNAQVIRKNGKWSITLNNDFIGDTDNLSDVAEMLQPYGNVWALRRDTSHGDTPCYKVPVYKRKNNA